MVAYARTKANGMKAQLYPASFLPHSRPFLEHLSSQDSHRRRCVRQGGVLRAVGRLARRLQSQGFQTELPKRQVHSVWKVFLRCPYETFTQAIGEPSLVFDVPCSSFMVLAYGSAMCVGQMVDCESGKRGFILFRVYCPPRADEPDVKFSIVAEAKERLQRQPHLSLQRIWCEFDEGDLFLRGQVPSFYLKQLAQTAVAGLDGVCQVVNEIEVVW